MSLKCRIDTRPPKSVSYELCYELCFMSFRSEFSRVRKRSVCEQICVNEDTDDWVCQLKTSFLWARVNLTFTPFTTQLPYQHKRFEREALLWRGSWADSDQTSVCVSEETDAGFNTALAGLQEICGSVSQPDASRLQRGRDAEFHIWYSHRSALSRLMCSR